MVFDNRYRPQENKLNGPAGTIADYSYSEDATGNITAIHDLVDASYNRDFGYDDLNRLTTANGGSSLWGLGGYEYDAMGNMLSRSLGNSNASFTYSGTTPKLTNVTENERSRPVAYDPAGNESVVGSSLFEYSPSNHLSGGDGYTYRYDGRGVRVSTSSPAEAVGSVSISPSTVYTNQTAIGTVTLQGPASAGGAVVSLDSSDPAIVVPATVTVPPGGTTAIFGVTATTQTASATITARHILNRKATVTFVAGPPLASISTTPTALTGGATAQG